MSECKHEFFWYAAPADERGWKCAYCNHKPGEDPGYSPEHDRDLIERKVECVMLTMHEAGVIYVSNGCGGDHATSVVSKRCRDEQAFDSVTIARFILELEANDRHTEFWRKQNTGILSGNDPRDRCDCGKLANSTTWRNGQRVTSCSDHWSLGLKGEAFS